MREKLLMLFATAMLLAACSSTSTPDLKLIMILHCGTNNDSCNVTDDKECSGRGRFSDFREDADVIINDNGNNLVKRHEIGPGTFDENSGTCTFSDEIATKSSSRYRIYVEDAWGPFDFLKSELGNQNWSVVLEFNQ